MKHALNVFVETLSFVFQQGLISKEKKNLLAAGFMKAVKEKDFKTARNLCAELQIISERKEMSEVIEFLEEEIA